MRPPTLRPPVRMLADLRLAWRALRRSPAYLVAAACTLALGVGLNTALFSVVDAVVLRPLPYRAPERLVSIDVGGYPPVAKAVARTLGDRTTSVFSGLAYASTGVSDATLGGGGVSAARVGAVAASGNLFDVLGVAAARGRALRPGDDAVGRDRVAVLSDRLWRDRFNADPRAVGRTFMLDGVPREVVGVMPAGFAYPSAGADVWVPATLDPRKVGDYWFIGYLHPVARLRDGVSVERALAAVRAAVPSVRAAIPWRMPDTWGSGSNVQPLGTSVVGGARTTLFVLWAATGVLLAAACVNAANLALAAAVLASLAAGLLPALRASRPDLAAVLGDGARGASAGRGRRRAADALVVVQVALAVLLAAGAGLLGRSVANLLAERPGFRPEAAAAVALTLPSFPGDPLARGRAYYDAVIARAAALPGVRAAAVASRLPIDPNGGGASGVMTVEAHPTPLGAVPPGFDWYVVTPDYLRAAGIPLRAGRAFGAGDDAGGPPIVLVDSTAAARYWPGEQAVGQRVQRITGGAWLTVVGVVGAVRLDSLNGTPTPSIYFPLAQNPDVPGRARLVVRGEPAALSGGGLTALHDAVAAVDRTTPVGAPRPLAELVAESAGRRRFTALLAAVFAAAAVALGAMGVYGVVAYAAAARTRELGVRAALGATAGDLRVLVLADGGRLAAWGVAAGVAAALVLGRSLGTLLYGVSPADPVVLVGVPLLLAAVTLAASALPARRAARVDPLVAMRAD